MKEVHNVTLPNNYPELVNAFLTSEYFSAFIKLIVLVNLLGIFLTDYSFRAEATAPSRLSKINAVSLCLQLFANCVFTLEIGMKLYQNDDKLRNAYLYFNLGGTLATYIIEYADGYRSSSTWLTTIVISCLHSSCCSGYWERWSESWKFSNVCVFPSRCSCVQCLRFKSCSFLSSYWPSCTHLQAWLCTVVAPTISAKRPLKA